MKRGETPCARHNKMAKCRKPQETRNSPETGVRCRTSSSPPVPDKSYAPPPEPWPGRSGSLRRTIPGGGIRSEVFRNRSTPDPWSQARRRWPRPPLRPKRFALRAPQGCAAAEPNEPIPGQNPTGKSEQEKRREKKPRTRKTKATTKTKKKKGTLLMR